MKSLIFGLPSARPTNTLIHAVVLVAVAIVSPSLQAQEDCTLRQITSSLQATDGFNAEPVIDAAGDRVAFTFWRLKPDASVESVKIVLWDQVGAALVPITTSGASNSPSISGAGDRIVFQSTLDLVPPRNDDRSPEIFLYTHPEGTFAQLTELGSGQGVALTPTISADGRRVAFLANGDLVPGDNADGNFEVFVVEVASGAIVQASDTIGDSLLLSRPVLDADGSRVAFSTEADPGTGGNPEGNSEVYLYDLPSATLTQVTETPSGINEAPSISDDGSLIAFLSQADLVPDGNSEGNKEVFVWEAATSTFRQLTQTSFTVGTPAPSISGDGTQVAYAQLGEIRLYDLISNRAATIVSDGFSGSPSLNADGTRLAFVSNGDLVPPGNADNNQEIYLATCPATSLYLNDSRFRVRATWRTQLGTDGSGQAVQLTDDSGYLWFFNPKNIELVVKVLDACALPQFNNFWVFIAGLTNVEVTITVTDTVTNEDRFYTNPLLTKFDTVLDTVGFRTCDASP